MAQKRTKRRRSSGNRKKSGGSMLPWYAAAVLAVGGMATYGQWGDVLPRRVPGLAKIADAISVPHPSPKPAVAAVQPARPSALPTPPAPIPASSMETASTKPVAAVPVPQPMPVSLVQATAPALPATPGAKRFAVCADGQHANCVVDGNTFWAEGVRIRLADIETPEANAARCPEEQRLGAAARLRLVGLLNDGTFAISPSGYQDHDLDGSKLRLILREGRSVGDQLVKEGLARRGATHASWCSRA